MIARLIAPLPKQAQLPFPISDEVMMQLDTKRHPEEETAALREEIARLRALLYGKKSERVVAANLDLTIEEAPAKDETNALFDNQHAGLWLNAYPVTGTMNVNA